MKVFISWSGSRGKHVAMALKNWLSRVVQACKPWISVDIGAGRRWNSDLSQSLQECQFAVVCITPESQDEPWILFEAGAIAKALNESFVCPDLMQCRDPRPLGRGQSSTAMPVEQ